MKVCATVFCAVVLLAWAENPVAAPKLTDEAMDKIAEKLASINEEFKQLLAEDREGLAIAVPAYNEKISGKRYSGSPKLWPLDFQDGVYWLSVLPAIDAWKLGTSEFPIRLAQHVELDDSARALKNQGWSLAYDEAIAVKTLVAEAPAPGAESMSGEGAGGGRLRPEGSELTRTSDAKQAALRNFRTQLGQLRDLFEEAGIQMTGFNIELGLSPRIVANFSIMR